MVGVERLRTRWGLPALACLVALLAGCGADPPVAAGPTSATPTAQVSGLPTKVLVVIEENHSLDEMRSGMPYLAGLSARYGYATDWSALAHPSEPNYLAIAGGSTFGVTDDRAPGANAGKVGDAASVFGEALRSGHSAGTYAESMPSACFVYDHPDKSVGTPLYAVRHNPWVYFSAERSSCLAGDQDTSTFAADARNDALPNVGFLIPDLQHDAHDGTLAMADAWLRSTLPPVLASEDFTSGRLAVVVTADEDDKHHDNVVLTSVLDSRLHHVVSASHLTHYSLTRFIDQVLGIPPQGSAASAPDLATAFGLSR